MTRIKNMNDVLVGALLIVVAVAALVLSWRLTHGSAARMGPGYVPRLLIFVQIGLAIAIIAQVWSGQGEVFERWFPRPLFWLLVAVTFFGMSIEALGLVVAVFGLVILSTFGHPQTPLLHAVTLAAGMALFSVLVFVEGLGLSILVWPAFLVR